MNKKIDNQPVWDFQSSTYIFPKKDLRNSTVSGAGQSGHTDADARQQTSADTPAIPNDIDGNKLLSVEISKNHENK